MKYEKIVKNSFCVIGKVGSTNDGEGFVERLWQEANQNFHEVEALAKKDENGHLIGVWGAMTDFGFRFLPWEENFSKGLYLAGIEAEENAIAPPGWKKWILPGFECLKVKVEEPDTFSKMIAFMKEENIELAAAVQDFTDPTTGQAYMLFPVALNDSKAELIRRVKDETNQVAYCGFHCEYCFMGMWCGGCRSACNMCSYATVSDDNHCIHELCCKERNINSCSECAELAECKKGFYKEATGHIAKAYAMYISRYGEEAYARKQKEMGKEGADKIDSLDSLEAVLAALEY